MSLKKLVVELTNLCNLDCDYCFKEPGTSHIDLGLLERILEQAQAWGASKLTYTGGEPLLHPRVGEALRLAESAGYRYALVTNGWHFDRALEDLKRTRAALSHVFFSLDSSNKQHHDQVRGTGSFQRIMSAVELCREHDLPFSFLCVVNRRNELEMEELSLLAKRTGAVGLRLGHLMPSPSSGPGLSLTDERRRAAEEQASRLESSLDMTVSFSAAARDDTPGPACEPLAGRTATIDCRGRLSLCCQLAEYRGAANQNDIVADLRTTDFGNAYAKFLALAAAQRARRDKALAAQIPLAAHPCDFCISSFQKVG